ncbi:hypothetical protein [Xanthomonas campestris]
MENSEDPSLRRITDLLQQGDGYLDLILRGHLHIEQMLRALIDEWAVNPKYVTEAKLSFSQKLNIVRSLNLHHPDEPIWQALGALNSLRNDFAHQLNSDQREKKIQRFIALTVADSPQQPRADEATNTREELLGCLAYLMGSLEGMMENYALRSRIAKSAGKILSRKA